MIKKYEFFKHITFGDKILFCILLLSAILSLYFIVPADSDAEFVSIRVQGVEQAKLPLSKNKLLTLAGAAGEATIEIKNGQVRIVASDCPQQICVKTGRIKRQGEIIVCVPNRIIVHITGNHDNNFNVVTE